MSRKTKRLEKENEIWRRKAEAMNGSILKMAEEREAMRTKTAETTKKAEKLVSIIEQMQQQGRKVPPNMAATLESCYADSNGHFAEREGSEYSDEDDDEGHSEEFDDDTEEEPQPETQSQAAEPAPASRPYGPERPPVPAAVPQAATNGH